jgi:hypothetical protein
VPRTEVSQAFFDRQCEVIEEVLNASEVTLRVDGAGPRSCWPAIGSTTNEAQRADGEAVDMTRASLDRLAAAPCGRRAIAWLSLQ